MSETDRRRWDRRHAAAGVPATTTPAPPAHFAHLSALFPTEGRALELACGRGSGGVWLADRGMDYLGVDVSTVAVARAGELASALGLGDRCRFEVWDLDRGLPPGAPVDLLMCHLFRDRRLDQAVVTRLAPGGMLAIAALSEIGAGPGRHRSPPGDLERAFGHLEILDLGEGSGVAWLVGRRSPETPR